MSKAQILRGFTLHLLTTAADEISEQFERTIAEYEAQLCLLREENERQKKLLDTVLRPQISLYRAEKQKEREQLRGPEEDLLKVIVMKSEAQEEDQAKQREPDQMETGPPKNPSSHQETEVQTENFSELKTEMMFQERRSLENHSGIEPFTCSLCPEIFKDEMDLRAHMMDHGAEEPYSCSTCYQKFTGVKELEDHECVSGPAGASWKQSGDNNQGETSGPPGSHQVFTDLDSFLSCTAEKCVFCRTTQQAHEKHLRNKHLRGAIYFLDDTTEKFAVACFCKETSDSKRSHYHCPFCEYKTLVREFNFKQHMQKIHGIAAGKIKGLNVYDVQRTKPEQEEPLCGSPEENERQQEPLDADLDPQLCVDRPGSHQVFTDLDSFLSCTAEECVFCRTKKLANEKHLRNKHLREAVYFLDDTTEKFVVACFCKETSDSKRSHYHCPFCEYKTLVREFNFKQHMLKIHRITARKIKDREWAQQPWESDTNKFLFPLVPVRGEDDDERPHSSQLPHRQAEETETGAEGDDYGGPDPETEESSEPETDDSDDWREQAEHTSGLNSKARKKSHRCPECRKIFETKRYLARHMRIHLGEKPFSCSECDKEFFWKGNLKQHMEIHKERNVSAALSAVKDDTSVSELTYEIPLETETDWLT